MKKELFAVCAMACAAASFAGNSTSYTSENAIASLGVDNPQGKKMIAVPFNGFGGGSITVSNLVACSNLPVGDKLYLAADGQYLAWEVAQGDNGRYWRETTSVSVSGVQASPSATSTSVVRGDGFWLETESATTAYLLGEKPSSDSTSITLAQGLNLVGITSATTSKKLSEIDGTQGDRIILSGGGTYVRGASGWKNLHNWSENTSSFTFAPGAGFWYYSKNGGSISL